MLKPNRRTLPPATTWAVLTVTAALWGCVSPPALSPTSTNLYEQLGGEKTLADVVHRTIERSAADARTQRSFKGIKLAALKQSLAQQICALAAGPCRYEGETMARAHADTDITASEFDAMVSILREELDAAGVGQTAKNRLLALLAPMKRDIVAHTRTRP